MKVAITSITHFDGKDGRSWTKIGFLKVTGEVGEKMFPRNAYPILSDIEPVTLPEHAFATELSFDERGRLVTIQ